ncbi:MAG: beta-glucosidase, partial [Mucilaginibacter sp.]
MKNYFSNQLCRKIVAISLLGLPAIGALAQTKGADAKMDAFVNGLMSKMTLDEKIGQLNLVTSGAATTGSIVNQGVEQSIKKGDIGGIFGVYGTTYIKKAQELAVQNSR